MPREKQFDEAQAIQRLTQVFQQKGYNACSVGDLVAASGLSRSSLYDTFGDKEQLFVRCLQYYGQQLDAALAAATNGLPTAVAKLEAVLQLPYAGAAGGNGCTKPGCLAVNTMSELDGLDTEVHSLLLTTRERFERYLAQCIREGQEAGELVATESAEALARLLYTLFCGLLVLQKAAPDQGALKSTIALALSRMSR